jgi:hypothetical protein
MNDRIATGIRRSALTAALALTFLATGCKEKTVDDATLGNNIQQKLASDTSIGQNSIQVNVAQGTATLNGQVSSDAARALAANDVAGVAGVAKVINNLVVGPPPSTTADVAPPPMVEATPIPREVAKAKVKAPKPAPIERVPAPQPAPAPAPVARNTPPPPPPAPAGPTYRNVTLAAGSTIPVRVTQTLDSATTQVGDTFSGVIASDVIQDDLVVLQRGTTVTGRVTEAKDAGHFSGNSLLTVELSGVNRRGERIAITTEPYSVKGAGRGSNTAKKAGIGAVGGAILGGILGGGKGAAIGAGVGGAGGAGINAVTKGQEVQIPSESIVRFRIANSVQVRTVVSPASSY